MSYKGIYCILDICLGQRPMTWTESIEYWLNSVYRGLFNTEYELNMTTTLVAGLMVNFLIIMTASYFLIKRKYQRAQQNQHQQYNQIPSHHEQLSQPISSQPLMAIEPQNAQYCCVDLSEDTKQIITDDELDEEAIGEELSVVIQRCSAESSEELESLANMDEAFETALIDPNQKLKVCESRPLPLQTKVRDAIQQQLEARFNRPSKSSLNSIDIVRVSMQKNWKRRKKRK